MVPILVRFLQRQINLQNAHWLCISFVFKYIGKSRRTNCFLSHSTDKVNVMWRLKFVDVPALTKSYFLKQTSQVRTKIYPLYTTDNLFYATKCCQSEVLITLQIILNKLSIFGPLLLESQISLLKDIFLVSTRRVKALLYIQFHFWIFSMASYIAK